MMKAGTYYIGDLCYVLGNRWEEVCDETIFENNCLQGEFFLKSEPKIPFAMFGTAYGDGCYPDNDCRDYSVDSGTIGCVSVEYLDKDTLKDILTKDLGHIHEFTEPFQPTSDGRLIQFGHVEIDTDPETDWDDEYDESWREEEEEEDEWLS